MGRLPKEKQALSPDLCGLFVFKFMFINKNSKYLEKLILFENSKLLLNFLILQYQ